MKERVIMSSGEGRSRFGDILCEVLVNGKRVVISQNSKPIWAAVSMHDLQKLEAMESEEGSS